MCRLTKFVIWMVLFLQTCFALINTHVHEEAYDDDDDYSLVDWPFEQRVIGEATPSTADLVSFSPNLHKLHFDDTTLEPEAESDAESETPKSIPEVESSSQAFDDPLGTSLSQSQEAGLSLSAMDSVMIGALVTESITTAFRLSPNETGLEEDSSFERHQPSTEPPPSLENTIVEQLTPDNLNTAVNTNVDGEATPPKVDPTTLNEETTTPQLLIGFLPVRRLYIPISGFKDDDIPKNSVLHGIPRPYFNPHKEPQRDLGNLKPISNTNAHGHVGIPGKVGQAAPAKPSKHGKKWNLHPRDEE
ncbi:hypothetical protein TCAL_08081 [Tigriopus californicus]|uniref:Folded gastrulation N-terminal domain-containing protein n=1 Tax=Tigriopus californicus TaxID=6832 RepID=A0A553NV19_TIGCA|nr:uncharacterized protein LOC131883102 [Tigriopus californicus]TRY69281.1 hypothetical protein TCAL_08081 [Tigriopus californicus]|eukprot:TCALIF_08081-PA protein Name:"Protein of unknown function" AED:0.00 eAED:0.00 QI:122/1/1/1/0.5/0.4/5/1098/302